MTTETAVRCGHCLDPLDESMATDVAGSLVCATCARLARPAQRIHHGPAREGAEARGLVARPLRDVDAWCAGRWWAARVPFVLFFAWIWMGHATDPLFRSVFGGLNLGIHELGHYVFGPFGELLGAFGGSLLQCLVPLIAAGMFARQRDYFAVMFALAWFATNCFEVATYAGDAVRMELPLVTPGGGHAIHDWNYLLGAKGWLRYTEAVARAYRAIGHVTMGLGVVGMSWIIVKMIQSPRASSTPTTMSARG